MQYLKFTRRRLGLAARKALRQPQKGMFRRKLLAVLVGVAASAGTSFVGVAMASSGQNAGNGIAPLLTGPGVLASECTTPSGGVPGGFVVAHTNLQENATLVHVTLLGGLPDTTYVVSIACQREIGLFTTNNHGYGATNIEAPGATTGTYEVDVRVNGSFVDYREAGPFIGG